MNKVYLLKYKRTPIGNYLSNLSKLSALELGTLTVSELVNRCKTDHIAIPIDIGCRLIFFIKVGILAAIKNVSEINIAYFE